MAVLSLPPSLFTSAQLTPRRISADLLKSLCDKCEFAFIALLVVGCLLTIMLLFMGARRHA